MASATRIIHSTISDYIREEQDNILRERVLLAMLQKKGRISYNRAGEKLDWKVKFDRQALTPYGEGGVINFTASDRHRTANLDWRQYIMTDSITKKQGLQNRGAQAIIKIAGNLAKNLSSDFRDKFCEELFVDGESTANSDRLGGLLSCFRVGNGATALEGTCTVGDGTSTTDTSKFCITNPASKNYAGLATDLGALAGDWGTTNWPIGRGDESFDYWTPPVINYGTGEWNSTTAIVAASVGLPPALRFANFASARNKGKIDFFLMDWELYRNFLEGQESKQEIQVLRGGDSTLTKLGFEAIAYDGIELTWEYGLPSNEMTTGAAGIHTDSIAFGLNLSELEICSMQSRLFESDKDDDITTSSDLVMVDFYGQMRINPRNQCLLVNAGDS